ncbi:chymotrypsin-2-like [Convolutriloba macropyga]|uniref:chymotrypsin-2-like n=1 Tax=Convolutriloba macropyga TaxID=536237 RepID=UPI003F51CF6E
MTTKLLRLMASLMLMVLLVRCDKPTVDRNEQDHATVLDSGEEKIIHGFDAPQRLFFVKIHVYLPRGRYILCGGVIVGRYHVLSAAHCFDSGNPFDVFVGDFAKSRDNGKPMKGKVKIHEKWSRSLLINDIAIVKLYKPVSPSRVLKMCNDSHARDNIAVCGLGRTIPDVKNSWSVRLLETHIQENRSCIFNNEIDQSKTICFSTTLDSTGRHYGACKGDSGGPSFPLDNDYNPKCAYGLVSYGGLPNGDLLCLTDEVHTRVSAYKEWIEEQMCINWIEPS